MTKLEGDWMTHSRLLYQIAYLQTEQHTPKEIMSRLDVSQPTVSKYTQLASQVGLIKKKAFVWSGSLELLREVSRTMTPVEDIEKGLRKLSKAAKRLIEVEIVVDNESTSSAISSEFAKRTARYLLDGRLPKSGFVGVAWGGTLLGIADAVEEQLRFDTNDSNGPSFVPICGDPPEVDRDPKRAAANIAGKFELAISGKSDFAHSFSSVSGCMPRGFEGREAETIRAFFLTNPGYARVFGTAAGKKGALANRLDGCLTSLRSNEIGESWLEAASEAAGFDSETLAAASTGNISGLFLSGPNATAEDRKIVEAVNARWSGIQLDHLERCARNAEKDPSRLGVVVIAGRSASQISTAIECVRLGLANRLVVDPHTAEALKSVL